MSKKTVKYVENHFNDGQLILIGQCAYELKLDTLNNRYFVINQNNELIYLDQIDSVAVVQINSNKTITTSFFYSKKNHHYFRIEIFYILVVLSLIVFLSFLFYFFKS